jgi:hypothetical protein
MKDVFNKDDPRNMPEWLFPRALRLDYTTVIRAEVAKQNYSILPRFWYIDATVVCVRCGKEFCFTAREQKTWYEEYVFWIDTFPKRCITCRRALREIKELRKQYDRDIARALGTDDLALKQRMIELIDRMEQMGVKLGQRVGDNRRILGKQIPRLAQSS